MRRRRRGARPLTGPAPGARSAQNNHYGGKDEQELCHARCAALFAEGVSSGCVEDEGEDVSHCGGRGNSTETGGVEAPGRLYSSTEANTMGGGGEEGLLKGRGGRGERQRSRLIEDLQAAKSSAMMQNWIVIFLC
jgi:hypothetical protein